MPPFLSQAEYSFFPSNTAVFDFPDLRKASFRPFRDPDRYDRSIPEIKR
jgi:hypothetical protein